MNGTCAKCEVRGLECGPKTLASGKAATVPGMQVLQLPLPEGPLQTDTLGPSRQRDIVAHSIARYDEYQRKSREELIKSFQQLNSAGNPPPLIGFMC